MPDDNRLIHQLLRFAEHDEANEDDDDDAVVDDVDDAKDHP